MIALWTALAAAACPEGAHTGDPPATPAEVVLLAVSEDDAWADDGAAWIGRTVRVDNLESTGRCWYSGRIVGDTEAWFYQVAFKLEDDAVHTFLSDPPPPTGSDACPSGVLQDPAIARGRRVRIAAIHPEDAYVDEAGTLIGSVGATTETWSRTLSPCWYTGAFIQAGGQERYFYRVAVRPGDSPRTEAACPPGAVTNESVTAGTRVKVVGIHPDDRAYTEWPRQIGAVGVADGALISRGSCWVRGTVVTDDGQRLRYDRAAVWRPEALPVVVTDRRINGPRIPSGQRVRIVDVHEDDAYYPERSGVIGLTCVTTEALRRQEPGYFSGELRCDDRRVRYFLKVAVENAGFR